MGYIQISVPNTPPIANGGNDQTVECTSPTGTPVTLDGSGSGDPDDDALTYTWTEGTTLLGTGETLTLTLVPGVHTITLTVEDGNGGTDDDEVIITINADTGPPVITLNGDNPLTLIRFRGAYVEPGAVVTDNCDSNPSLVISGTVDSNLPGQYTITYDASDANSNTAQATRTVDVIYDSNVLDHPYLYLADKKILLEKMGQSEGDMHSNGEIDIKKGSATTLQLPAQQRNIPTCLLNLCHSSPTAPVATM